MNVREILSRQPPEVLYHYTTQAGMIGIVSSEEIWASHTQYLNDIREFRHAICLVQEELSEMKLQPARFGGEELLSDMEEDLKGIESINVCVCSFSAHGDVLSQWRAYGGRASGFSIGFSGALLGAISNRLRFWLVPVVYDEGEQRELVRTLLEDVIREYSQRRFKDSDEDDERPAGNLVAYLNRYAPILKHKSFSEEREWRIISHPLSCKNERFDFRASTSMLVPYFKIPLSSAEQPFAIQEVVVGPTPHPEQSISSIKGFLIKHNLASTSVRSSEVPYRNW